MSQNLSHKLTGRRFDFATATVAAAKHREVSPLRIAFETAVLRRLSGKLNSREYFTQGAWRPGLTWAERRQFIGKHVSVALNTAINPPPDRKALLRVDDKIVSGQFLVGHGIPMPRRLAVAAATDPDAGAPWLDSPEATLEFLRSPGVLPCFGKPAHSTMGLGAVRLMGLTDTGALIVGGGRTVTPEALVAEIWANHPRGYVFDELIVPHPDLAAQIGPVIGTLRIVTINSGAGPEVLYAACRGPAAGATVDSSAGQLGVMLAIDSVTGRILRMQDRTRLGGMDAPVNPVTGRDPVGEVLPDYPAALEAALAAHRCLPERGVLGTDIMLSDRGAVVGEVNGSPYQSVYQMAFARGLLNAELLPRLKAVRARFSGTVARPRLSPLK